MNRNIFLIVLIVILVLFYVNKMYEPYDTNSYDITQNITTNMDLNGATLSKYPYYTNNLVNPPADVLKKIQNLQKYQPKLDGVTDSTYVATKMNIGNNLDNLNNKEEFTMMNPYIHN